MASGESRVSRRYDKENLLWQSTVAIKSDPVGSIKYYDRLSEEYQRAIPLRKVYVPVIPESANAGE